MKYYVQMFLCNCEKYLIVMSNTNERFSVKRKITKSIYESRISSDKIEEHFQKIYGARVKLKKKKSESGFFFWSLTVFSASISSDRNYTRRLTTLI